MKRIAKAWLEYEQAVAAFVQAMDSSANVKHNAFLPDADTGARRQRDVWVEGRLCGFIPIKVLISCKRYKRALNEQDVDHFLGEIASSGAHKGLLYSYSGFNELAIEKGRARGVSCMQLLRGGSVRIPDHITFPLAYCCYPRVGVELLHKEDPEGNLRLWSDLLSRRAEPEGGESTVAQYLSAAFLDGQTRAMEGPQTSGTFPASYLLECTYDSHTTPPVRASIRLRLDWDIYQANIDAYVANGAYSLTEREFYGQIHTPSIDTWSATPGPGWTRLVSHDPPAPNRVLFVRNLSSIADALSERMGPRPL